MADPEAGLTGREIAARLAELANRYPESLRAAQRADVPRIGFHIGLASGLRRRLRVCDIGGGVGLFSPGCAALGLQSVLVDDFGDEVNAAFGEELLALHRSLGVEIVSRDAVAQGLDFPEASLDVVTSFDSMEHWHHSPKRLFGDVMRALKPGGRFVLGVPNCVNLRKRLTVPLGRGKWSSMEEWYEAERFRGHVREPDVSDLRYIARDLGLRDIRVLGRNWQGRLSPRGLVRAASVLADYPLRICPSLCSDIYVVGVKPGNS